MLESSRSTPARKGSLKEMLSWNKNSSTSPTPSEQYGKFGPDKPKQKDLRRQRKAPRNKPAIVKKQQVVEDKDAQEAERQKIEVAKEKKKQELFNAYAEEHRRMVKTYKGKVFSIKTGGFRKDAGDAVSVEAFIELVQALVCNPLVDGLVEEVQRLGYNGFVGLKERVKKLLQDNEIPTREGLDVSGEEEDDEPEVFFRETPGAEFSTQPVLVNGVYVPPNFMMANGKLAKDQQDRRPDDDILELRGVPDLEDYVKKDPPITKKHHTHPVGDDGLPVTESAFSMTASDAEEDFMSVELESTSRKYFKPSKELTDLLGTVEKPVPEDSIRAMSNNATRVVQLKDRSKTRLQPDQGSLGEKAIDITEALVLKKIGEKWGDEVATKSSGFLASTSNLLKYWFGTQRYNPGDFGLDLEVLEVSDVHTMTLDLDKADRRSSVHRYAPPVWSDLTMKVKITGIKASKGSKWDTLVSICCGGGGILMKRSEPEIVTISVPLLQELLRSESIETPVKMMLSVFDSRSRQLEGTVQKSLFSNPYMRINTCRVAAMLLQWIRNSRVENALGLDFIQGGDSLKSQK